jgi:hypothetical protein
MPSMRDHQSGKTTKMLLLGDPGSGKSGSLCSLADAGYNLRIVDMDNGIDIIRNTMLSKASPYKPDAIDRIIYETVTDPLKNVGGKLVPKQPKAWQRAVELLMDWKTESEKLGPLTTWTSQDVLVIDSLTHLCNAAMNFVLFMNARLGQHPHQSDWYQAQQLIESMIQMLYDESVKCNVIMSCHIKYIGEDNGPQRGYPEALGKSLAPKIGSYFNTMVLVKTTGVGAGEKHKILTKSTPGLELKTSNPLAVKAEYPIETGLAELFKDLRAEPGK